MIQYIVNTSIVSGPESVSLVVGGTITFSCSATSDPSTPVQISWEFDGSPLNPSTGKYTMSSGSLTISDAQPSDEGTYTCVATNGYSTDSASADLLTPGGNQGKGYNNNNNNNNNYNNTQLVTRHMSMKTY